MHHFRQLCEKYMDKCVNELLVESLVSKISNLQIEEFH